MRQQMFNTLILSGAFNSNPSARLEKGGYIYQKPDGTREIRLKSGPATPCNNHPGAPEPLEGESVIGVLHTHPFSDGDILPLACHPNNPLITAAYDSDGKGGGSKADWDFIQTPYQGQKLPMYIIDKDEVFRLDPDTPPSSWHANPNRWRWNNSSCPWWTV